MGRSFIVKSAIVLVVLVLVHSVFWFFKAGQLEKQVNNFVSENGFNVSIGGEVAVSGFPLSQKVTIKDLKFIIPAPALDKYQTTVKHLEAHAGIFGTDFKVAILGKVIIQDSDDNNPGSIEFNSNPEISLTIAQGVIAKFIYQDSGYKALDADKNVIYTAASSKVSFESAKTENEKIKNKITANIAGIEGFDVLDIYKNYSEKKIIDGLKTGEITVGNNVIPAQIATSIVQEENPGELSADVDAEAKEVVEKKEEIAPTKIAKKSEEPIKSEKIRSSFVMSVEYDLVPNSEDQDLSQVPTDPLQIQEIPSDYSRVIRINAMEFSNSLYKVSLNGQMSTFQDDVMPSGSVTIKVDKSDNLVSFLSNGFSEILKEESTQAIANTKPTQKALPEDSVKLPKSSEELATSVNPDEAAAKLDTKSTDKVEGLKEEELVDVAQVVDAVKAEDPYHNFLKRVIAGLPAVSKELAGRNQLTQGEVAAFDIRREKNIEFLINETPIREILGKF